MRKFILGLTAAALVVPFAFLGEAPEAQARGKMCKADHFHSWSSSGNSKRNARAAALSGWKTYTSFEYGNAWANFRMAGSRSLRCYRSSKSWSCTATGRPCRRA